jgi:arsenate reductase
MPVNDSLPWVIAPSAAVNVVKDLSVKLLFICTHNRCRSILAEAICNHLSGGRLTARSAGSQPVGQVHPLSLKYLSEAGIATAGLRSKSWDEHENWHPDFVITVCDSAAGEACPVWFSEAEKVHWGLVDPSRLEGNEEDIANAFRQTIDLLQARFRRLLDSDFESFDRQRQKMLLEQIKDS